jgi:TetR/AcrR family transcriptional regulator
MARPIAADHGDKRVAIRKAAARLFAEQGYDRTSMAGIAAALGVSKALFYHYYSAKEALLLDIIRQHLAELVAAAEGADDPGLPAKDRLRRVVAAILDSYRDADAEHKIQINHLSRLAPAEQEELKALERRIVAVVRAIVVALRPDLPGDLVKPLTMSLFGILNWKYMWFREGGPMTLERYIDLVTSVFAAGVAEAGRSG